MIFLIPRGSLKIGGEVVDFLIDFVRLRLRPLSRAEMPERVRKRIEPEHDVAEGHVKDRLERGLARDEIARALDLRILRNVIEIRVFGRYADLEGIRVELFLVFAISRSAGSLVKRHRALIIWVPMTRRKSPCGTDDAFRTHAKVAS